MLMSITWCIPASQRPIRIKKWQLLTESSCRIGGKYLKCRYAAVLFDLDGTLIDTAPDFIRIVRLMSAGQGREPPADEHIRQQVSEGARAMVRLLHPDADDQTILQHRETFLTHYAEQIAVDTTLFAGMDALLQQLEQQAVPWGIVTNKPRHLAVALLAALGLTARCSVLVCPDDVQHTKPDPEPMYLAADQLGLPAGQMGYIGDHPRDIEAGRRAGMTTVIAEYGYLPPGATNLDSWQADIRVCNVAALYPVLWPEAN